MKFLPIAATTLAALLVNHKSYARDSIAIDYESVLDEIENQGLGDEEPEEGYGRWTTKENLGLEGTTLEAAQHTFVRFKGLYEGIYKGFYRNTLMEHAAMT